MTDINTIQIEENIFFYIPYESLDYKYIVSQKKKNMKTMKKSKK